MLLQILEIKLRSVACHSIPIKYSNSSPLSEFHELHKLYLANEWLGTILHWISQHGSHPNLVTLHTGITMDKVHTHLPPGLPYIDSGGGEGEGEGEGGRGTYRWLYSFLWHELQMPVFPYWCSIEISLFGSGHNLHLNW
jgi:hypothetical protein